jgi:hypothetical protein
MEDFSVNGKPAFKIFADKVKAFDKATLFDCEGDRVWLPNSSFTILDDKTILIQEWIYNEKFN